MRAAGQVVRLGELLVELGLFQPDELAGSIELALEISLPLGRALVLSGRLREDELRAALQIQELLRRGALKMEDARRAFHLVRKERVPLSSALDRLALVRHREEDVDSRGKLVGLLLDAGLVTAAEVSDAQRLSYDTGTPVGRMLAISGAISYASLARALELLVLVRQGKLALAESVEILASECNRRLSPEHSAEQRGLTRFGGEQRLRLGELLMMAGLLSESDLLNVIEVGLMKPKPIGDVLVAMGVLTPSLLCSAVELQGRVNQGKLDLRRAAAELQALAAGGSGGGDLGRSLELQEPDSASSLRLGDLLQLSGIIDVSDIQQAVELSGRYPAMIGKMLVVSGAIDEGLLLAALRCQFLIRNRLITVEQAIEALRFARAHRVSLDDALEDLGFSAP